MSICCCCTSSLLRLPLLLLPLWLDTKKGVGGDAELRASESEEDVDDTSSIAPV